MCELRRCVPDALRALPTTLTWTFVNLYVTKTHIILQAAAFAKTTINWWDGNVVSVQSVQPIILPHTPASHSALTTKFMAKMDVYARLATIE